MSDQDLRAYAARVRRAGHDPAAVAFELLREDDGYVQNTTVESLMRQLAPWLCHVAGPATGDMTYGPPLCGYVPAEGTGVTHGGPASASCLLCLREEAATLGALENRLTSLGMGHLVRGEVPVTTRMVFLDTGEQRCAEIVRRGGSLHGQCGHVDGHAGEHARALGQCWARAPHLPYLTVGTDPTRCARLAVRYANGHAMCDEHARAWEERQASLGPHST